MHIFPDLPGARLGPSGRGYALPVGPQADFSARFMRVSRALKKEAERRFSAHGVHAGQQFVLQCLWEEDGLSAGELAHRLGVEPGTITRALRRMGHAGLVERRRDEVDRRKVRAWLTDRGWELRSVIPEVSAQLDRDAVSQLDDAEAAQLFELLDRVQAGMHGSEPEARTDA